MMEQALRMNQAQYEVLSLLSCLDKQEDVAALKNVIVQFLNQKLQTEIDELYENGTLSDDIVDSWKKEHFRTPYVLNK